MSMKDFKNFYFPGKPVNEDVVMVLRRHKMALANKLFIFVLGGLAPIVVYTLVVTYTVLLDDDTSLIFIIIVLLAGIYYLYIILFMYHAWVDYYLDIWIITEERIIATEQKGLFNREVSELRLSRIQDVSCVVKGFFPTIFKYGSIHVQTASESDRFNFGEVPNAVEVSRKILALHEKLVNKNMGNTKQHTRTE